MQSFPRPTKTYHTTTYDRIAKHHGFDGTGKTVLITGGASGIGYSFAQAFARAGVARIAIVSRSSEQQQQAKTELEQLFPSTQIVLYQASVTAHAQINNIIRELNTIDVLILNAAIAHGRKTATELNIEEVQTAFEVNTIASFNLVKAYLQTPSPPATTKTIINISSGAAHMVNPYRLAYGAIKAATAQIMQSFAAEQKNNDNVKIFSFHPGSFYTPGVAENMPKSMMQWEDINLPADFALWLAGPESAFLHGRHLWANWDVDELVMLRDKIATDVNFLTIGLVQ